jgi:hypothetical protein
MQAGIGMFLNEIEHSNGSGNILAKWMPPLVYSMPCIGQIALFFRGCTIIRL